MTNNGAILFYCNIFRVSIIIKMINNKYHYCIVIDIIYRIRESLYCSEDVVGKTYTENHLIYFPPIT